MLSIAPKANTLSLVYREAANAKRKNGSKGIMQFTRYVNHLAPASLYQYSAVYRLEEEDGDDDGEDDDDGEEEDEGEEEDKKNAEEKKEEADGEDTTMQ